MSLTAAQKAILKSATQADTNLTAFVAAGNDAAIAEYYAATTATIINIQSLPKADFLLGVLAGIAALNGASPLLQGKWDRFIRVLAAVDNVRSGLPAVQSLLGQLVTDGLMTQPQVDAFSKRPATRAENLLGTDTVILINDVAQAMRP